MAAVLAVKKRKIPVQKEKSSMARYFTHCMILAALAVGTTAIGHAQECKRGDDACIKKSAVCVVQNLCTQKQIDKANGKKVQTGGKKSKKGKG